MDVFDNDEALAYEGRSKLAKTSVKWSEEDPDGAEIERADNLMLIGDKITNDIKNNWTKRMDFLSFCEKRHFPISELGRGNMIVHYSTSIITLLQSYWSYLNIVDGGVVVYHFDCELKKSTNARKNLCYLATEDSFKYYNLISKQSKNFQSIFNELKKGKEIKGNFYVFTDDINLLSVYIEYLHNSGKPIIHSNDLNTVYFSATSLIKHRHKRKS